MMHRSKIGVAITPIVFLLVGSVAYCQTEYVDQIHAVQPVNGQAAFVSTAADFDLAQTFTVGIAGVLSKVEVGILNYNVFDGTLTLDVSRVVSGQPDFSVGGVLASMTLPFDQIPMFYNVDVYNPSFTLSLSTISSEIHVTPGEQLAIIMRTNHDSSPNFYESYIWWTNNFDPPYSGGNIFTRRNSDGQIRMFQAPFIDTHFRTFVVVPEPSPHVLVFLALLGVAPTIRRVTQRSVPFCPTGEPRSLDRQLSWCELFWKSPESPTPPTPAPVQSASWRVAKCGG
jgi:hypothetical protein